MRAHVYVCVCVWVCVCVCVRVTVCEGVYLLFWCEEAHHSPEEGAQCQVGGGDGCREQ